MDTFKCLFKLLFEAQNMYVFIDISAIRENIEHLIENMNIYICLQVIKNKHH